MTNLNLVMKSTAAQKYNQKTSEVSKPGTSCNNYSCNLTVVRCRKKKLKELRGKSRWTFLWVGGDSFFFTVLLWQTAPPHAGVQPHLSSFLRHWNESYTQNMSSRRETSHVLITAQSNKPVLHYSSKTAFFTWEAELVNLLLLHSLASLTPAEQSVLHQGHNGWFDLKRSNYPQQWRDLIVYWWRRERVIEVKLEVIVSGRCEKRWNGSLVVASQPSDNNGWLMNSYQWMSWGLKVGHCTLLISKASGDVSKAFVGYMTMFWAE